MRNQEISTTIGISLVTAFVTSLLTSMILGGGSAPAYQESEPTTVETSEVLENENNEDTKELEEEAYESMLERNEELGISYIVITEELASQMGLSRNSGILIEQDVDAGLRGVEKGSLAEEAGLATGDILAQIDGKSMETEEDFRAVLQNEKRMLVRYIRGGEPYMTAIDTSKTTDTTIEPEEERTEEEVDTSIFFGVHAIMLTEEIAERMELQVTEGALLSNNFRDETPAVTKNSPAYKAGLQSGDIILSIDGITINQVNTLISTLESFNEGDRIEVEYMRGFSKRKTEVVLGKKSE